MLESVKIQRRQSEIRQQLATLVAKTDLTEDETRSMSDLEAEYGQNEQRYRAALIAEDTERRDAGAELETRDGRQWAALIGQFELRQVALALDEGRQLSGQTAEVVSEMRNAGGYQGIPVPLEAMEVRAGETTAGGTPDPISTRPIVDRLFAETAATQMGAQFISIPQGEAEWPIVTSAVSAGWADGELADVAGPTTFATTDVSLRPDHNYGVQMEISRKAMKQSGAALEQAVRRDMNRAITVGLDAAIFQGTGATGQPLGVVSGASTYGINEVAINAAADFDMVVDSLARFMVASAATPGSINMMIRPEVWAGLMKSKDGDGNFLELVDRIQRDAGRVTVTNNGLPAPTGSPLASSSLLTSAAGGLSPIFVGMWGGIDMIRDPYSLAASGQLKLTGILTADVNVPRAIQLEVLTGVQ
ncbi:MAG: phage major capsid protein [Pseudomonadota bacterium]